MTQESESPPPPPIDLYCGDMNCYDLLGVTRDSNTREIAKAYRQAAGRWHPDKHHGAEEKKKAEKTFMSVASGYEVGTAVSSGCTVPCPRCYVMRRVGGSMITCWIIQRRCSPITTGDQEISYSNMTFFQVLLKTPCTEGRHPRGPGGPDHDHLRPAVLRGLV